MKKSRDEMTVRRALKRFRRYAEIWKWGGGYDDIAMADQGLEALDRMGERLDASVPVQWPTLKGLEEQ